ncbi:MAG: helix-turn-helix domain-containing protein [Acidimicrobiales bacterium]
MADTRDRILAATNESFRRQGYHGTSIKDVTRAAGATIGSLYHFFPGGKTALAEAVIIESGAAYRRLFELIADEALPTPPPPSPRSSTAPPSCSRTPTSSTCPIGTVAREVASTDNDLRTATDAVFRSWIDAAAERFTPTTPVTPPPLTTPSTRPPRSLTRPERWPPRSSRRWRAASSWPGPAGTRPSCRPSDARWRAWSRTPSPPGRRPPAAGARHGRAPPAPVPERRAQHRRDVRFAQPAGHVLATVR